MSFTPLSPEQAAADAWQQVDADMGYTILGRLQLPDGSTASVLWQASKWPPVAIPTLAFYGTMGSLHLDAQILPARRSSILTVPSSGGKRCRFPMKSTVCSPGPKTQCRAPGINSSAPLWPTCAGSYGGGYLTFHDELGGQHDHRHRTQ
ncbi:MAG: hypothetical protein R2932_37785 [Caldilineaceae bacterium]